MANALTSLEHRAILARDENRCRKCCRSHQLAVHHITPRWQHGSDEESNLITLCAACHAECHAVTEAHHLTFEVWLPLPSYGALLSAYLDGPADFRAIVDSVWSLRRAFPPESPA